MSLAVVSVVEAVLDTGRVVYGVSWSVRSGAMNSSRRY